MRSFYRKITKVLAEVIREEFSIDSPLPLWELPSREEFGDFSSMVALKLASKLNKNPAEIADRIKGCLQQGLREDLEKIEIVKPGFINIFFARGTFVNFLNELLIRKEDFFRRRLGKKVLLEFVSANPTGPLSIAHGRQAVVGDVIANIFEFFGNKVTREYYVNDVGKQLDLLVKSVEARINEIRGQNFSLPKGGYQGEYVKQIAKEYINIRHPQEDIRKFVLSHVLSLIKSDLNTLRIEFNNWRSQQDLINDGEVTEVIKELKRKGLMYERENAFWFKSAEFGDDKDRVITKGNQEFTYFASDVAYHWEKAKRGYDYLINIWGPDHHGYISRVKASMEALGVTPEILEIIIMQLVSLKSGARMSKRKGTVVLLSELVKEVGADTARFYYLTRRNSSHLDFDIDLAKEASFNNPLYYIQYACARIESIFRKASKVEVRLKYNDFLQEEEEVKLVRQLMQFFYYLEKAYYSREPVFLVDYLKNLARVLHKFYERRRVLGEQEEVSGLRLNLLVATKIVIYCALNLLGITPVKEM